MTFAILWLIVWGFVFGILDNPSTGEIIGFIIIGVIPPVYNIFFRDR